MKISLVKERPVYFKKNACIFGKNSISLTNQKFGTQAKILY